VEVAVGGAPATAVALVQLEASDSLLPLAVEVGVRRVARLDRRLEDRVDQRGQRAAVEDGQRAADPAPTMM